MNMDRKAFLARGNPLACFQTTASLWVSLSLHKAPRDLYVSDLDLVIWVLLILTIVSDTAAAIY